LSKSGTARWNCLLALFAFPHYALPEALPAPLRRGNERVNNERVNRVALILRLHKRYLGLFISLSWIGQCIFIELGYDGGSSVFVRVAFMQRGG